MAADKVLIAGGRFVSARILDKRIVSAEIHAQRCAAAGAIGNQFGRNAPVVLFAHHAAHGFFIVVGRMRAGDGALPQAVIPLGVKQTLLVKARSLETVIHIGGEDKVILVCNER